MCRMTLNAVLKLLDLGLKRTSGWGFRGVVGVAVFRTAGGGVVVVVDNEVSAWVDFPSVGLAGMVVSSSTCSSGFEEPTMPVETMIWSNPNWR